jgi:hypothetical protein
MLCNICFFEWQSLASLTFESDSKVQLIGGDVFSESGLGIFHIPFLLTCCAIDAHMILSHLYTLHSHLIRNCRDLKQMQMLWSEYLCRCKFLGSVPFESDSQLQLIDEYGLSGSGLTAVQSPTSFEILYKETVQDRSDCSICSNAVQWTLFRLQVSYIRSTEISLEIAVDLWIYILSERLHNTSDPWLCRNAVQ